MATTTSSYSGTEARDMVDEAKEKADQTLDQAQEEARKLAEQAQQKAKSAMETRKGQAASGLSNLGQAFRQTGNQLREQDQTGIAQYTERVAGQVDRFAGYLEGHSVDEILNDVENFARRQPELFIGGAVALGLLTARFLKSSNERRGTAIQQHTAWEGSQPGRQYPPPESYTMPVGRDATSEWAEQRARQRDRITEEW